MDTSKTLFWIVLDLLIIAAIANLIFFVMPAVKNFGNSLKPARTVSVSASGKTTAVPDMATVDFSVVSQGKNPQDLSDENNRKMSAVIDNVKSQGVADGDIKTISYNLSPDYKYDQNTGRSFITGYTLTQTVEVKIHDLLKTTSVVGGLAPLGVNQIGNIVFSIDDNSMEQLIAQARDQAIAKAKTKAEEIAGKSGSKLGKVVEISEFVNRPVPYAVLSEKYALGGMAAPVAPPIQPGSQDVISNVSVIFALE